MTKTKHRLEDKLNLILLILENPGIKVEDLIKFSSNKSIKKLKEDLEGLVIVGSYPYQPIDLIDIEIQGDRVFAKLPSSLDKSISLHSEEWSAIVDLILKEISFGKVSETEKKVYNQILEKLKPIVSFQNFSANEEKRNLIQKSIDIQKKIKFSYKALKKENLEEKIVNPNFLFFNKTEEYFSGYYDFANSTRFFKLSAISNLEILNEELNTKLKPKTADSLNEFNLFLQKSIESSETSILEIDSNIEFNLSRHIDFKVLEEKVKILKIQTHIPEEIWFLNLIKNFGDKIKIISPEHIKEKYIKDLKNISGPELI